ncbi:hypothetical protein M378DRAFT_953483 [Amanita muscaria Koide BX008]|uniref:Uncharacterized protein n=1 Tax=Amanita muscaria (strain Koide BX008) TaxID=946122 RepID=A0A0C2WV05_AMAMK|nr:hypothetical protein M378DRAFT_953483 [Amanita muscaria Koide BX008]
MRCMGVRRKKEYDKAAGDEHVEGEASVTLTWTELDREKRVRSATKSIYVVLDSGGVNLLRNLARVSSDVKASPICYRRVEGMCGGRVSGGFRPEIKARCP